MKWVISNLMVSFLVLVTFFVSSAQAGEPQIRFFTKLKNGALVESGTRYLGDQTVVRLEGLQPGRKYTVRVSLSTLQAEIAIRADGSGVFQSDLHAPESGSYSTVDADGLFWSLKGDMSTVKFDGGSDFSVSGDGVELARANLKWLWVKPSVSVKSFEVAKDGFRGLLYLPKGGEPKPLVIAWSGSEGGLMTGQINAAAFANAGYPALGLAYFGEPGLPASLAHIPLEYFTTVFNRMKREPGIRGDQLAITGGSRGGELALLVGAMVPDVKAVIAVVPSPYLFAANIQSSVPQPAWTLGGMALPFLNVAGGLEKVKLEGGVEALSNRRAFADGLTAAGPLRTFAHARLELTNGPIMLIGAEDDQVWASADHARMAYGYLRALGRTQDEMHNYKDAGHDLGIPIASDMTRYLVHPQMKINVYLGGMPAATAFAKRDSWERMKKFVSNTFGFYPKSCDEQMTVQRGK